MTDRTALAEFLRTLRNRTTPESLGLVPHPGLRRVRGLRREELAQLAGLSVSYYVSLEQGRALHASADVLRAIARALKLDEFEENHLLDLGAVQAQRGKRRRRRTERLDPHLLELLHAIPDVPAFVHGPSLDILAWNRLGHALYAPHVDHDSVESPATRPNIARLVFRDPEARALYVDWHAKAEGLVGLLRDNAGKDPGNTALSDLIGELSVYSPEFAGLWTKHVVRPCSVLVVPLRHPHVGEMTVTQQALNSVSSPQQVLVVATVAPTSPSQHALRMLASLAAPLASSHALDRSVPRH
ncbi:helix-turn-helix transcriptional regulator [Streptomyces antimycoticus]|uniref:helix-turn-helix transcriptional regulator n=1 Tax=Streptomyces antimycoticus TaxID=68175 RepID=UPI0034176C2A